jgi:hypothetical protein
VRRCLPASGVRAAITEAPKEVSPRLQTPELADLFAAILGKRLIDGSPGIGDLISY